MLQNLSHRISIVTYYVLQCNGKFYNYFSLKFQALKYQHLVNLVSEQKLDLNVRSTFWKGTTAFLILHSQRNTSMTAYGTALSDTLSTTTQEHIIVFLGGLKEVFSFSESLSLGQYTLIGNIQNIFTSEIDLLV